MANRGDGLLRRTGKTLSVLVFETTKHSRIMKKRMRIGKLQKQLKADYRDLGFLVYAAVKAGKESALLADDEIKALVDSITMHDHELERLREGIARIARAKKLFSDEPPATREKPRKESGGPVPEAKKRAFLGLKKKKASEELLKKASRDLAPDPKPEKAETPRPAAEAKAKRSLFGFGMKKSEQPKAEPEKSSTETPKPKPRKGFLGLGRKTDGQEPAKDKPDAAKGSLRSDPTPSPEAKKSKKSEKTKSS